MTKAEHNYGPGRRRWGHDVAITKVDGKRASVTGWGTGIREGDIVLLPNPHNESGVSRYQVETISYFPDPRDMWHAKMIHAPVANTSL
jgi:hypothetical protein